MKTTLIIALTGLLVLGGSREAAARKETKPRIEVCFVLDTTSSMSGLIEGAKQKIWSIANEMVSAKTGGLNSPGLYAA